MKTAHFIDFDDSFSFNVLQKLEENGLEVSHQNWADFESLPDVDLLILGPGPGHPDDYTSIFPLVRLWLSLRKPFFGLCLGHQIYWRLLGAEVRRSLHPKHGQRIKLTLPENWKTYLHLSQEVWVQRYNSLSVSAAEAHKAGAECLVMDDEILATRGNKILTYQFHPESEGTTYPNAFFRPLLGDLV